MQPATQDKSSLVIFGFGSEVKSSVLVPYSRQHGYHYFKFSEGDSVEKIVEEVRRKAAHPRIVIDGLTAKLQTLVKLQVHLNQDRTAIVWFHSGQNITDDEKEVARYYKKLSSFYSIDCQGEPNEIYKKLRMALTSRVIFFYGPPLQLKTEMARNLATSLGYQFVSFDEMRKQLQGGEDGIVFVNKFIKWTMSKRANLVVDGFVESAEELAVLQEYLTPLKAIHVKPPRDEVEAIIKSTADTNLKTTLLKQLQKFTKKQKEMSAILSKKPYYFKPPADKTFFETYSATLNEIQPKIIYIETKNVQLADDLAQKFSAVHLNINESMRGELERQTVLAENYIMKNRAPPFHVIVKYLKDIIYGRSGNIVLSGMPLELNYFLFFEKQVAPIWRYVTLTGDKDYAFNKAFTPQMYYMQAQKLLRLEASNFNPNAVTNIIKNKKHYLIVNGPQTAGKSTLCRTIAKDYGYKHIEMEPYLATLKEKLLTPEDGQELPVAKIIKHFKQLTEKDKILIDWLPYEGKDLQAFLDQVGNATIINMKVDNKNLLKRNRKKNETDVNAEVTEEDTQKMEALIEKNNSWLKSTQDITTRHPQLRLFQLDSNGTSLSLESFLPAILKPRVFLVAASHLHKPAIFLNIALRFHMDLIEIGNSDLRGIQNRVNECQQRDILLYGYSLRDNLISDDISWIEKNVGKIRYVAVWSEEEKQFKDQIMKLERPPVEPKKKIIGEDGEEKEEEPPAEQDDGQPKKPKIDIFNYEWSVIGNGKNLSQWILAYKQPIKEVVSDGNPQKVVEQFTGLYNDLNNERDVCIYHLIK